MVSLPTPLPGIFGNQPGFHSQPDGPLGGDVALWPPGGARGQQVTRPESFNGICNAAGREGSPFLPLESSSCDDNVSLEPPVDNAAYGGSFLR